MRPQNLRRGAPLIIISSLLFALMGATVKSLSDSLSNEMVVFFRNALSLLILAPWLLSRRRSLSTACFRYHLLRTVSGLGAMYCFFYAIGHLHLAEAALLNFSMPLFMPFIALLWLREPIPHRLWWAIGLGFVGVILILKPGPTMFRPEALVGLAAGVQGAVAQVSVRRLARTEPTTRIVFYFLMLSTLISAVPLLWSWQNPSPGLWILMIGVGVFGATGQLFLTRAYAHAPAGQIGPFLYSAALFAGLLDWGLWGELPDLFFVSGALLVVLGGVLLVAFRRPETPAAPQFP